MKEVEAASTKFFDSDGTRRLYDKVKVVISLAISGLRKQIYTSLMPEIMKLPRLPLLKLVQFFFASFHFRQFDRL